MSLSAVSSIVYSSCSRKNALMVPSFSSGEKVQVEYTSTPPGFTIFAASSRIIACLSAHIFTFSRLHSSLAASSLRNIPSPEQGASTRTRSKKDGNGAAIRSGFSLQTTQPATPIRSTFWDRMRARSPMISLETNSPCPCIRPAICVLFPPGAAHRSRIRSPGSGASTSTAAIAEGS